MALAPLASRKGLRPSLGPTPVTEVGRASRARAPGAWTRSLRSLWRLQRKGSALLFVRVPERAKRASPSIGRPGFAGPALLRNAGGPAGGSKTHPRSERSER